MTQSILTKAEAPRTFLRLCTGFIRSMIVKTCAPQISDITLITHKFHFFSAADVMNIYNNLPLKESDHHRFKIATFGAIFVAILFV